MVTIHATCVAFSGKGVLLRGPSGSGKSDLALRALAAGARLIADDRVELAVQGDSLIASAPESLFGLIEVRGLGVVKVQADAWAPVALVADLGPDSVVDRMPEQLHCEVGGVTLPWMLLAPFESSAVAKLHLALQTVLEPERLLQ